MRMVRWICAAGVATTIAALAYLSSFGPMSVAMVASTVGGVFVSVVLGCGLFAAGFFSDKSGHDDAVSAATDPRAHAEDLDRASANDTGAKLRATSISRATCPKD